VKKRGKAIILSLLILTLGTTIITIGVQAVKPVEISPSISYGGVVNHGDGTYTFTYYVTSGTPVVKKWTLYSTCFKNKFVVVTAEAWDSTYGDFTPDFSINKGQGYIEFKHESKEPFTNGMTRTYYITLNIYSYAGIPTGDVQYGIHWPSGKKLEGLITGPMCPPDMVISESPLGVIGPLTSLLAAAGLFVVFKKNLISIKLV